MRPQRFGFGFSFGTSKGHWTPNKIGASLVEWLEGDSMTVSAGHVTSWADKSSRGVTIAEATNPPTYSAAAINGHDAATFDGVAQAIGAAAQLFTTSFTIAAVMRPKATGANPMVTNGNASTGVELLEHTARRVQLNGVTDCDGAALAQVWQLWMVRHATTPTTKLEVNGTIDPLSNPATVMVAPAAGSRLTLGARWNGSAHSAFGPCDVAALLVCNTALNDATTALLTAYLRSKYRL